MSIPIGLTIFNVIFLNEFPDYEADRTVGNKRNIVVRLGKEKGIIVYIAVQAITWIMFAVSMIIIPWILIGGFFCSVSHHTCDGGGVLVIQMQAG